MIKYIPFSGGERPFSTAVRAGDTLYVSGQVGINRDSGQFPATVAGQTEQAIANLKAILEQEQFSLADIVKMTVIVTDKANIQAFNNSYRQHFPLNPPARTLLVAGLAGEALVELDAIAVKMGRK